MRLSHIRRIILRYRLFTVYGLQTKDNKKQINKLNSEINSTEIKISKLIDLHLEDKVDKITYEEKYGQLSKTLKELKAERIELDTVQDEEKTIRDRLIDFKKIFENAKPLEEFDGDVFKTVVEKVVIGGYNEDGIPDPYMLTFIFKTGLNTKIDGHKALSKMKKNTGLQKCTYQEGNPHCRHNANNSALLHTIPSLSIQNY